MASSWIATSGHLILNFEQQSDSEMAQIVIILTGVSRVQ